MSNEQTPKVFEAFGVFFQVEMAGLEPASERFDREHLRA